MDSSFLKATDRFGRRCCCLSSALWWLFSIHSFSFNRNVFLLYSEMLLNEKVSRLIITTNSSTVGGTRKRIAIHKDVFGWIRTTRCLLRIFVRRRIMVLHAQRTSTTIVSLDGSWSCPGNASGSRIDHSLTCPDDRQTTFEEAFSKHRYYLTKSGTWTRMFHVAQVPIHRDISRDSEPVAAFRTPN